MSSTGLVSSSRDSSRWAALESSLDDSESSSDGLGWEPNKLVNYGTSDVYLSCAQEEGTQIHIEPIPAGAFFASICSFASQFSHLTSVQLNRTGLTNTQIYTLIDRLKALPLTFLDLSNHLICKQTARKIVLFVTHSTTLQHLNLSFCSLPEVPFARLLGKSLSTHPTMMCLDLSGNSFDKGALAFAKARGLELLEWVRFKDCKLTESTVLALANYIRENPKGGFVDFTGNSMSALGRAKFKDLLGWDPYQQLSTVSYLSPSEEDGSFPTSPESSQPQSSQEKPPKRQRKK